MVERGVLLWATRMNLSEDMVNTLIHDSMRDGVAVEYLSHDGDEFAVCANYYRREITVNGTAYKAYGDYWDRRDLIYYLVRFI